MITATRVGQVNPSARGDQILWHLSEPVSYDHDWETDEPAGTTEYVITSAANVMFSGPETYIFPADANGGIIDWGEMAGSFKGALDHDAAIRAAGWVVSV